jgi:hypothetical protein
VFFNITLQTASCTKSFSNKKLLLPFVTAVQDTKRLVDEIDFLCLQIMNEAALLPAGRPGVDVMITIFCDFRQFSAKKMAPT